MTSPFRLLSLGDSYTIGENVQVPERFPNQAVSLLKNRGIVFDPPHILATTGWTTDELQQAINESQLQDTYDFVTLLIGVNNQYRGRSLGNYRTEFRYLLLQAIRFAGNKPQHVIVLSIPDWGVTPFAEGRNREIIGGEIDDFNDVNQEESNHAGVLYLDITPSTRDHSGWLAEDGLHPSGEEYHEWAKMLVTVIENEIRNSEKD